MYRNDIQLHELVILFIYTVISNLKIYNGFSTKYKVIFTTISSLVFHRLMESREKRKSIIRTVIDLLNSTLLSAYEKSITESVFGESLGKEINGSILFERLLLNSENQKTEDDKKKQKVLFSIYLRYRALCNLTIYMNGVMEAYKYCKRTINFAYAKRIMLLLYTDKNSERKRAVFFILSSIWRFFKYALLVKLLPSIALIIFDHVESSRYQIWMSNGVFDTTMFFYIVATWLYCAWNGSRDIKYLKEKEIAHIILASKEKQQELMQGWDKEKEIQKIAFMKEIESRTEKSLLVKKYKQLISLT